MKEMTTMREAANRVREYCGGQGKIYHLSKEFSEVFNYAIAQSPAYTIGGAIDVFLTMINPMMWSTDFHTTVRSLVMVGMPKPAALESQSQNSTELTYEVKLRLVDGNVGNVHAIDNEDQAIASKVDEVIFKVSRA